MSALLKTMAARLSFASRLGAAPLVMAAPAARPASPRSMVTRAQVTQKDLIAEVMRKAQLTNTQADAAVRAVFTAIATNVAEGEPYVCPQRVGDRRAALLKGDRSRKQRCGSRCCWLAA